MLHPSIYGIQLYNNYLFNHGVQIIDEQPGLSGRGAGGGKGGGGGGHVQHITNDAREDEMDDNLG